jgi:hypothetical protein
VRYQLHSPRVQGPIDRSCEILVANWLVPDMAGTLQPLTTQPLLRHSSPGPDISIAKEHLPPFSLHALEDGDGVLYSSDEDEDDDHITPRPGFWQRLRMSIRRRNGKSRVDDDFGLVRLPDEKKPITKYRLTKRHAVRACVVIPLLVIMFL